MKLQRYKMNKNIKNIWIETEESSVVFGGTNNNSDVIVTFSDNTRHVATFFTYENIEFLRRKNKNTGECLNGKYFWASDMIIVDLLNRKEIIKIINHLILENEFDIVFNKIK